MRGNKVSSKPEQQIFIVYKCNQHNWLDFCFNFSTHHIHVRLLLCGTAWLMEDLGAKATDLNSVIVYYLFLGSNGIQLINKDNCRGILFCLFKGCGWRQKMKLPQTKEVGNMVSLQVQNLKEADTFS